MPKQPVTRTLFLSESIMKSIIGKKADGMTKTQMMEVMESLHSGHSINYVKCDECGDGFKENGLPCEQCGFNDI
jgi:hypothetical protein